VLYSYGFVLRNSSPVLIERNDVWTPYRALIAVVDPESRGLSFGLVRNSSPRVVDFRR